MATSTKPRARKAKAADDAATIDAADAARTDAVQRSVDQGDAARAEAEAREAERKERLNDLKGRMSDELAKLTESDKDSAVEARLHWVNIGNLLNEGRALFTNEGSNNVNDKAFGMWIEANGLRAIGQRPTRAAAAWLADVYNFKPELYAMFPTESENGEPLRRSPRTLKAWVQDQVHEVFQEAWEADADGVAVASEADKDSRADVAKDSMRNVREVLAETLESAEHQRDEAHKALSKAKDPAARQKAMAEYESHARRYDDIERRVAIMDQHDEGELLDMFVKWKPRQKARGFKECSVQEAADRLFALLKTHDEFSAVYDALGVKVDELQQKVDADAGAVDAVDTPDNAVDAASAAVNADADGIVDSGEDDEDFDGEDFDGEDFDGEDFDGEDFDGEDFDGEEGDE